MLKLLFIKMCRNIKNIKVIMVEGKNLEFLLKEVQ